MPLNIKDNKTHELARKLAALTGESLTKAVKHAIEDKLRTLQKPGGGLTLADELDHIAIHCAALPKRDLRKAEDIIGYDDRGLPE